MHARSRRTCARASSRSATSASISRSTGPTRASIASASSASSRSHVRPHDGTPDDPAFFYTDFLNYNVNRHNIWKQWYATKDGKPIAVQGPRTCAQIVWYTTPELPAHLVQPSMDVVGEWNEVLMETVRRLRGEELPRYPDVDCQTDDPDGYCFCQSRPDDAARR